MGVNILYQYPIFSSKSVTILAEKNIITCKIGLFIIFFTFTYSYSTLTLTQLSLLTADAINFFLIRSRRKSVIKIPRFTLCIVEFQTRFLSGIGGGKRGDVARNVLLKVATCEVWSAYSLKGRKGKKAFLDLSISVVIYSKYTFDTCFVQEIDYAMPL